MWHPRTLDWPVKPQTQIPIRVPWKDVLHKNEQFSPGKSTDDEPVAGFLPLEEGY